MNREGINYSFLLKNTTYSMVEGDNLHNPRHNKAYRGNINSELSPNVTSHFTGPRTRT